MILGLEKKGKSEIDSGEKLKPIRDFGDGSGRFAANIEVDGETVGAVVGAITESNTAYISQRKNNRCTS
jgi:hypothetical protein